jgi:SAM-dependent methyltransferase
MNTQNSYHEVRLKFDPKRENAWRAIVDNLKAHFSGATSALEIGAGYCSFINALTVPKRYALDESDVVQEYAAEGVTPIVGDVSNLSAFSDGTLDRVLASNIFEHLEDETFACTLAEVKRVLAPGGKLIIMQPNFAYAYREYFHDYTHKKIFTHVGLKGHLEAAGFSIEVIIPRYMPYSADSVKLPAPTWLIRLYLMLPWRPMAKQMLVIARVP